MFDTLKMTETAILAIREFAKSHPHETFYAFAIDANLLCFNSVEQFEITLEEYRQKYPEHYSSDEEIGNLRENTGDWAYQGFFTMDDSHGFDYVLYSDHYELAGASEDGHAPDTDYAKAMTAVVANLVKANSFAPLRLSDDFVATWVDHEY